jgi:hypothetical protein
MFFSRFIKALVLFGALFALTQPAAAQSGYTDVQQGIINGVIQNIIESVRDQIRLRRVGPTAPGTLRFSGEVSDLDGKDPFAAKGMENPFGALAYAKAPAMAVSAAPAWLYGLNLVGSADRAYTFNLGASTSVRVETVTGAFDITKIGVFTATDALTFIGTGSHAWSRSETSFPLAPFIVDGSIPSASGTLSYLNGGFSADFTVLASWVHNSTNTPLIAAPDTSSLAYTGNAQYRFDFPYAIWFEPTAGVTYTEVYTANFGAKVADTTEVHGGARVGTEMKWMGFTVQPVLAGSVFKVVDANFAAVVPPAVPVAIPTPGLLGGRGSGKITVLWTPNFSSYIEAHGSGVASTKTFQAGPGGANINPAAVQTIGAQAGLRYTF